jgi:methyl-accepting chemotaxis protein
MYKYKVVEKSEEDFNSVIEKTGIKAKFTLGQVDADARRIRKALVELEAQSKLENAKIENIEHHHPSVKDMGDEERFTIHMYEEAKQIVKQADAKIKEIKEALEGYEGELKDIEEQTGLTLKKDAKTDETK